MRSLVKPDDIGGGPSRAGAAVSRRVFQSGLLTAMAGLACPSVARANTIAAAESSRQARDEAIRALPLQRLQPAAQRRVQDITRGASVFRRLPMEVINCDPELFVFLIRYPEVVVNMWRVMGVTEISLDRIADYVVRADDGSGTKTDIELMYGVPAMHLVVAEGDYSGPLFGRRMLGRCVLLLRSGFQPDASGRTQVTNKLDVFLQIDNVGADLAARTMQSMIGRTADQNFVESTRFIEQVFLQSEINAAGMARFADRLRTVDAGVRDRFESLVMKVGQDAQIRTFNAAGLGPGGEDARLGARPNG